MTNVIASIMYAFIISYKCCKMFTQYLLQLKLAPRMPSLFIQIERDSNGLAKHMALKTIAELVYTLMYKFPGYPDIYTTLADALKVISFLTLSKMLWMCYFFLLKEYAFSKGVILFGVKRSKFHNIHFNFFLIM